MCGLRKHRLFRKTLEFDVWKHIIKINLVIYVFFLEDKPTILQKGKSVRQRLLDLSKKEPSCEKIQIRLNQGKLVNQR